jgi:hypothetical protein
VGVLVRFFLYAVGIGVGVVAVVKEKANDVLRKVGLKK